MKSFMTQIFLAVLAVIFLIKGGIGILAASWRFVLPIMFLGAAYYFGKKAIKSFNLPSEKSKDRMDSARAKAGVGSGTSFQSASQKGGVIEICPHCLSEVGSCPKCR
ncbi:MAG: hypothetical protein V4655_04370 [Bdellovibrionota bacterium]